MEHDDNSDLPEGSSESLGQLVEVTTTTVKRVYRQACPPPRPARPKTAREPEEDDDCGCDADDE